MGIVSIDNRPGPFTNLVIDIREREKIFESIHGVDAVIHCAALLTPHIGFFSESDFWQVNLKGTENLLEACLKYHVKRFVFTSTTSIYGHALTHPKEAVWVTEEFLKKGWSLPKTIDRVYVIEKAIKLLGYHPSHNFLQWFAQCKVFR